MSLLKWRRIHNKKYSSEYKYKSKYKVFREQLSQRRIDLGELQIVDLLDKNTKISKIYSLFYYYLRMIYRNLLIYVMIKKSKWYHNNKRKFYKKKKKYLRSKERLSKYLMRKVVMKQWKKKIRRKRRRKYNTMKYKRRHKIKLISRMRNKRVNKMFQAKIKEIRKKRNQYKRKKLNKYNFNKLVYRLVNKFSSYNIYLSKYLEYMGTTKYLRNVYKLSGFFINKFKRIDKLHINQLNSLMYKLKKYIWKYKKLIINRIQYRKLNYFIQFILLISSAKYSMVNYIFSNHMKKKNVSYITWFTSLLIYNLYLICKLFPINVMNELIIKTILGMRYRYQKLNIKLKGKMSQIEGNRLNLDNVYFRSGRWMFPYYKNRNKKKIRRMYIMAFKNRQNKQNRRTIKNKRMERNKLVFS